MSSEPIKNICEVLNGYAFKSENYVSEGVRIIRITNVQKGYIQDQSPQYYPEELYKGLERYSLNENDILLSLTGNVGRAGRIGKEFLPAALNQRVACIRVYDENKVSEKYVYSYLNSDYFEERCIAESKGAAQKKLSTEWVKKHEINIPPLETQIKIANELDTITNLIEKCKQQLDELDLLVKAKFIEMFGDPVENPMGWETATIRECCKFIGSGATPSGGKSAYVSEGVSLIRSLNVHDRSFKYFDLAKLNNDQAQKLKNVTVEDGDVLFNITGASVARTCIVPSDVLPARVNQHVMILRNNERVRSVYFNMFLSDKNIQNKLVNIGRANGATRESITKMQISEFNIIVPNYRLQESFENYFFQINLIKKNLNDAVDRLETLYKSKMQEYFR